MALTLDQKQGLGVALNEATFLDASLDASTDVTQVTLRVLSWDESGDEPAYPTVKLMLIGTTRLRAALRNSIWHDRDADVVAFNVEDLSEVIGSFGSTDLHGWDYIDREDGEWACWQRRLSLDHETSDADAPHYIHLFKEDWGPGPDRTLDLRIWFHDLSIESQSGEPILIDDFVRRGKRWWDAMYAGDPRTSSTGIVRGG